jgi:hypothetical protein
MSSFSKRRGCGRPGYGILLSALALIVWAGAMVAGAAEDAKNAERVKRAKKLYQEGAKYAKGCSDFVSKVLEISWEDANTLMGDNPTYVGVDNSYKGLNPGDVVGWKKEGGHGHVAIYIGEADMKFLDVKDDNQKPRAVKKGYGTQKLYKSSKY